MRAFSITITLAALLVSSAAGAAGGSEKGEAGKGATGPSSAGPAESPGGGKGGETLAETRDSRTSDTTFSNKTWEVGAGFEYHRLVSPYTDNAGNRNINYFSLYGRWDITKYDRVAVRWGVYQRFLGDMGETGVRMDDISFSYTRRIPIPGEVTLRPSFSITAPTSYGSQLASVYTVPRLALQADRRFGHFTLDARLSGSVFIVKYAEGGSSFNGGGNSGFGVGQNGGGVYANPKGVFSASLSGDFSMPFHEPLSIGASLYTGYIWKYDVCGSSAQAGSDGGASAFGMKTQGMGTCSAMPTVMQSTSQPTSQNYGGELYVRYAFPTVGGFKSDLAFAWAPLGDATMGYTSVINDGVQHIRAAYFKNDEVYFTLGGRY